MHVRNSLNLRSSDRPGPDLPFSATGGGRSQKRNDQGVEARPRRIDRTTKKRSVALKQLIEIIDQFQDKLIAWNDQGNENNEDMEDDAVLTACRHESTIDDPDIEVE